MCARVCSVNNCYLLNKIQTVQWSLVNYPVQYLISYVRHTLSSTSVWRGTNSWEWAWRARKPLPAEKVLGEQAAPLGVSGVDGVPGSPSE